jgi:glycosyltransferase involved in cell wall biosynthesis
MTKIAIVVMRYGEDIVGGAEYHARMIAEHLKKKYQVNILTTCAKNYHTWANEYPETTETINDIQIIRFKNEKIRDVNKVIALEEKIFHTRHTKAEEINWINENGPFCPELVRYIENNYTKYQMFIFFTFRYYTSYFGILAAKKKAFIVPEAENDPALKLTTTQELFQAVKGIFYNVPEERDLILNRVLFDENQKMWDLIGCGIITPERKYIQKFDNLKPYIVYLGRIEGSKGCYQLFDFYQRLLEENPSAPDLVLAGSDSIPIPRHKKIHYIGFVTESEKGSLLANAELLIMPSPYESLSLVTLEAMAAGVPVLVNGDCDVLKGHCIRSNAGLWYQNYEEFKDCLYHLLTNQKTRNKLSESGKQYVLNNYSWESVEKKYSRIIDEVTSQMELIIDYPFNPVPRWGYGKPPHPQLYEIINKNREIFKRNLLSFLDYKKNFKRIPKKNPDELSPDPNWINNFLPGLDSIALYGFMSKLNPDRYIEIGSGNSTRFARRAIKDHNLKTKITSIDPNPRNEIDTICDDCIRLPLEELDPAFFKGLKAGDILFVDNSHRLFTNSDVSVVFLEILPILSSGVYVQFHDTFLPYDYPPQWNSRYYSEQYMLAAYLLAKSDIFEIILPNTFISNDPELSEILMPVWKDPHFNGIERHGGSFWIRMK